jgi:hypothetical protein
MKKILLILSMWVMATTISAQSASSRIIEVSEKVKVEKVYFHNRFGMQLCGELYTPKSKSSAKMPTLIIGAPYGGVKEQGPSVWANFLAQRGFVCFTFDAPFMGESEGKTRNASSPELFSESFSAAVDYLGCMPIVDRNRIGVIGICGSGGFALSAAAVDPRIKAVLTASMIDISQNPDVFYAKKEDRQKRLQQVAEQRWKDYESGSTEVINYYPEEAVTTIPDGLDPMTAEFWSFYALKRGHHKNALGGFTTTSDWSFFNYHLLDHIAEISPRPVMVMAGEKASTKIFSEQIFQRLGEPKEFVTVAGANHVDLYDGGVNHDLISWDKVAEFFNKNMK